MLPVGIDTLKATIGRRGGLAKSNRFAVYITHPGKKPTIFNTNLESVASAAFQSGSLSLKSFIEDPRDMYLLCESTSLPGRQIATQETYTDLKAIKKPYAYMNEDVTMSFHVTNDMYVWDFFNSWQQMIIDTETKGVAFIADIGTSITIQVMGNNDFIPVKSVKLIGAYPVSLSAIELSNSAENQTLKCSITFAYSDWKEESIVEGFAGTVARTGDLITNSINLVRSIFN